MERHFTFPVLVAAAIHGGLLFGWPRGEVPEVMHYTKMVPYEPPPPASPPEEPEIEVVPEVKQSKGSPDVPPQNPDIIQKPSPTDFPMPITVIAPLDIKRTMDKIPLGPIGVPDGDGIRDKRLTILSSLALDNAPRTRSQPPIAYPYDAKRSGQSGTVTVEFTVDENGRVLEPRVIDSTDRVFEAAALAGVAKWRFEPGRREGRVVRFRMAVPIQFSLNE